MQYSQHGKLLRVLILEDVPADAELVEQKLRIGGIQFESRRVDHPDAYLEALGSFLPDIILSDYSLPGFDGESALALAREKAPHVPFVFVTGALGEDHAVDLLKDGATDFVLKDRLTRLPLCVKRALKEAEEKRRRQDAEEKLRCAHAGLEREVEERTRELKHSVEALRTSEERFRLLSGTAGCLLAAQDPQVIVNDLCRHVMQHLDCHAFFNFLVDDQAGRLRLNAWAGISEEDARKIEWLDYGVAVCGCVARDGERLVAEEIGSCPDPGTELIQSYGIAAYACHPLMVQDRLTGTLSFGTRTRSRFSPDDLALMKTVTDQVAAAMERMRLIQELRRSRDELEKRVQERTAELRRRAEQLSMLASELTLTEERERRRLAEILHDHLQQLLVAAKLNLECLTPHVADDQRQTFDNVGNLLIESIKTSRSLTAELSPPILYQRGLAAALEWLARWMHEKYELQVTLQVEPGIVVDQEDIMVLLFQSVRELLFNVVKHARVNSAEVRLFREEPEHLRIVVSDQGAGFDPHTMWEGGEQTCGFGMFSIRERLELLGGRLDVESAPGRGAAFTLVAPLGKAEPENEPAQGTINKWAQTTLPSACPVKTKDRIRLMLVDDHIVMRQGLSMMLNIHPDVEIVAEAAEGQTAIHLARELNPDVILMDINMPTMDGIEATRIIHAEMPHIRIIGLSMFEDSDIASAVFKAGAAAYLSKAGSTDGLLGAIRGTGQAVQHPEERGVGGGS